MAPLQETLREVLRDVMAALWRHLGTDFEKLLEAAGASHRAIDLPDGEDEPPTPCDPDSEDGDPPTLAAREAVAALVRIDLERLDPFITAVVGRATGAAALARSAPRHLIEAASNPRAHEPSATAVDRSDAAMSEASRSRRT